MCKELKDGNAKLTELRLDYAWKYFDSAAKQRMLFLNYFLIAVGILASAYGFALKEKVYPVAIYVCLFGLIASIGFIFFDIRMLVFVKRALRILETLERQELFENGFLHEAPSDDTGQQLGLARIEPEQKTGHLLTKTKLWIRAIEGTAALGFVLGIVFATQLLTSNNNHTIGVADECIIPKAEVKSENHAMQQYKKETDQRP